MREVRRILLLGAALVLAALLLPATSRREQAVTAVANASRERTADASAEASRVRTADAEAETDEADSGAEAGMPGVFLERHYGDGEAVFISVWRNRAEDVPTFYLFMPAGSETLPARWDLRGATRLFLGGKEIQDGDALNPADWNPVFSMMYQGTPYQGNLYLLYSANLDSLFVRLADGDTTWLHESKEHAAPAEVLLVSPDGQVKYEGRAERIRCRGNATFENAKKKSYAVKLEKKADLLDGGSAKRYTLLANAFDRSLIRNWAAQYLARETGVPYAVESRYVDLYLNGDFMGNYLLCEQIEIQENRIAIRDMEKETKLLNGDLLPEETELFAEEAGRLREIKGVRLPFDPPDVSGGYLLEMNLPERYEEAPSGFLTDAEQAFVIQSPREASHAQVTYISGLVQELEDALNAEDGIHPETGKHYTAYLDIDSFARHYIIEELTKNLDASKTSQFFYKPPDSVSGRLFAGPNWDHDMAFGLYDGRGESLISEGYPLGDPEGLFAGGPRSVYNLWHALYRHAEFPERAANIYREYTYKAACDLADHGIAEMTDYLQTSAELDALRWLKYGPISVRDESEAVASFLRRRADWLLDEWGE